MRSFKIEIIIKSEYSIFISCGHFMQQLFFSLRSTIEQSNNFCGLHKHLSFKIFKLRIFSILSAL